MMNIPSIGVGQVALTACFLAAGGLIGKLLKHRIRGLRPLDQLRAASYLTRFSIALEYAGARKEELRGHVDALRADLRDSAARSGLDSALDRLGPPRQHAARVMPGPVAPSWLRGLLWLLIAGAAVMLAVASFSAGVASAAESGETVSWSGPLWTSIEVTVDRAGHVSTADLTAPAAIPAAIVVFLVGSRSWRLLTRRPPID